MEQKEINHINVHCSTKNLKKIRAFVADTLEGRGIDDSDVNMMVLAVDEVCANLIIHSNFCNEDQKIHLSIKFTQHPGGVLFEITDVGDAFDYNNYEEPKLKDIIDERKRGSLGLILVRRIMDNIEFVRDEKTNICRLYKKIDQLLLT